MSHFTVLIIGENIEDQLAKYDENIETAPRTDGEVSNDEKNSFLEYYKEKGFEGTFEECYEEHGEGWNGNSWKKDSKGVWQEWTTYNPDSKWDWYQIGGRWSGFFKKKKGEYGELGSPGVFDNQPKKGYADSLLKKDIDFEGQRQDEKERAIKHYKLVESCFPEGLPKLDFTWEQLKEREEKKVAENIDYKALRVEYAEQEGVKIKDNLEGLSKEQQDCFGFWFTLDDFQCTAEEYGDEAYNGAISTYAMVIDGQWIGKGEMGWWGCSSGDMEQMEWNEVIKKAIDEAEDDVLMTMVDCHI